MCFLQVQCKISFNAIKIPRGKRLNDIEKGKILGFFESGVALREIARRMERSDTVVRNFLNDQENYGKNKHPGPKSKLKERDKRRIIKLASNSMLSCSQITRECQLNVSRQTVFRVIKNNKHIVRQKLKNIPKLLPRHKDARLAFARNNMNTDWSKVDYTRIFLNSAIQPLCCLPNPLHVLRSYSQMKKSSI